jgi:endonuclease/exonuclease/phosphatase (EEP) superfamily protein YafD
VRKPLTVLTANLLVGLGSVERVVRLIEQEAPDVIFFQEYTPLKAERLIERIGTSYPYRAEGLREHAFGAAIYSRTPFVGEPELYPHESIRGHPAARRTGEVGIWDPQPRAVIRHDGHEVVLRNVHFAPPIQVAYLREQRVMTGWICRWLGSERRAVVIAGDLNCTDSSVNLSDLGGAGLASVREAGRGWMGTWPSSGLAGLVPVGIDHILIRGLRCDRVRVGEAIDSDHLPLIARFGVE